ncbi:single-stranded-DNA-specific exonuclease RecJ [Candidatus Curtissbacteria bacterium RIFCSPLOWO2_01_FULL_39_62]|uniref:Single-stranded-DNA-specific exonuclease RecJ n=1 Tax=Candidatus Curtissbacteria bacterium RIFCSPHIGHO2_02_FULL_40_16b TaxID=1797714 RepID=A0A1F5G8V8_9BACT|nr:MAG: single-stranded-DNA-specific exonuclease RecJ [Candidatus Curtissbacteria bacterium RIFCSPHIGHO2_01_FULL_39_57]OGD88277.1 MAG: single-stranded-DNA-specific exonuclease RecJ [Candidatus Curtissbacteria bacterium RIFCSPHIGHO2_02_FULL_40_16b]OGD90341.1 MAG: single-stranded-DNA-specific exonuclease RecJ [Candidatus Curtissbacteria bacterium RIFCSPHIGHO2_12_FULL_38_37]OGE00065.1 MAG: single-stranded-DNA-specific exonuclease RecJ [Candidatus Curtissbacteria bacterium RIFCSPLOWO2_02_FULL_40_11]
MIDRIWKVAAKNYSKKSKNWLLSILANNRGLTTKNKLDEFLNSSLKHILDLKPTDLKKAVSRVEKALKNKEKIIVYSDYDADGICASAIVWETLFDLGADVMPYVPHRIKEGYGLSKLAIRKLASKGTKLIVTVDHGVTALDEIEFAKKLAVDIIVTDHHLKPKSPPKPVAMVHTTQLCGGGVAWRFCWEIVKKIKPSYKKVLVEKLELAAIATVADLVPLIGANRAIVKLGLEKLNKTKRPGLKSLIRSSAVSGPLNSHDIGHAIAPRINAMGRLEHGMDSLRLICAKNQKKADELASLLSVTNSKRQTLTTNAVDQALNMFNKDQLVGVLDHESWHQGVIGLVASKLVESHYRPMVAISRGPELSKGSARSIQGFNIVEAIRASSEFLTDAGGHPMAAGFTIKTKYIKAFAKNINIYAQKTLSAEMLTPTLKIECELDSRDINAETLKLIKTFEPYGVGNPSPIFLTRNMIVEDVRGVGAQSKHLKLQISNHNAIGFNMGEKRYNLRPGNSVDVVYTIDEDNYNGAGKVQMKIKDLRSVDS